MTHRAFKIPGPGPTLIVLHAAGTTPERMDALIGPVRGFNVVFPEAAKDLRWDHLGDTDAPFLSSLGGDFICGYSSGAFMAMRMTRERQYKGLMTVAGGLLLNYISRPLPYPCRSMLVHGTADRNVPYDGVPYAYEAGLDEALALKKLMGVTAGQNTVQLPNMVSDGCRAYYDDWGGRVRLYTVVNGGHTWPGSRFNAAGLGRTCMDIDATALLREFFLSAANP